MGLTLTRVLFAFGLLSLLFLGLDGKGLQLPNPDGTETFENGPACADCV